MIRQYGYRIEKVEGNIATIVFPDFIKYGTSSIKLNIKKNDVLNEMVYLLTEFVAECLKEFCPNIPSDNYRERELADYVFTSYPKMNMSRNYGLLITDFDEIEERAVEPYMTVLNASTVLELL